MRDAEGTPWVVLRGWLTDHGYEPNECVVATIFPEENGWVCVVLLSDHHVVRLDPTFGSHGDIRTRRAETTIAYWQEMNQQDQAMYERGLFAARVVLDESTD
jgi:hypothetical protein